MHILQGGCQVAGRYVWKTYFFLYVLLYFCVQHIHIYVYVYNIYNTQECEHISVHMYINVCVWRQKVYLGIILRTLDVFDTGSLTGTQSLPIKLGWPASEPWEFISLCLPSAGITKAPNRLQLFTQVQGLNSGAHACMTSTL